MTVIVSGQGDIQGVTSLNSGSFTFRNILYNGWVNTPDEINQRNLTFAEVSNGNYFADRWKRVSSTTMTQIVEEGNYIPNRTYTLSGTNVTTTQVTAPSSGNWDWGTVSNTASLVQLELGTVASSFEYRPKGLELSLCQRYYSRTNIIFVLYPDKYAESPSTNRAKFASSIFMTQMRVTPTGSAPFSDGFFTDLNNQGWRWQDNRNVDQVNTVSDLRFDAEL